MSAQNNSPMRAYQPLPRVMLGIGVLLYETPRFGAWVRSASSFDVTAQQAVERVKQKISRTNPTLSR